jgi:hypothetical protein
VILLLPPALCELCAEEEVANDSVLCWCCIEAIERLKPASDRQFVRMSSQTCNAGTA